MKISKFCQWMKKQFWIILSLFLALIIWIGGLQLERYGFLGDYWGNILAESFGVFTGVVVTILIVERFLRQKHKLESENPRMLALETICQHLTEIQLQFNWIFDEELSNSESSFHVSFSQNFHNVVKQYLECIKPQENGFLLRQTSEIFSETIGFLWEFLIHEIPNLENTAKSNKVIDNSRQVYEVKKFLEGIFKGLEWPVDDLRKNSIPLALRYSEDPETVETLIKLNNTLTWWVRQIRMPIESEAINDKANSSDIIAAFNVYSVSNQAHMFITKDYFGSN